MKPPSSNNANDARPAITASLTSLSVAALGVVFGDIGTSPSSNWDGKSRSEGSPMSARRSSGVGDDAKLHRVSGRLPERTGLASRSPGWRGNSRIACRASYKRCLRNGCSAEKWRRCLLLLRRFGQGDVAEDPEVVGILLLVKLQRTLHCAVVHQLVGEKAATEVTRSGAQIVSVLGYHAAGVIPGPVKQRKQICAGVRPRRVDHADTQTAPCGERD